MKYICPEYKLEELETKDIITASSGFEKIENEEADEVIYNSSLNDILGNLFSKIKK